jgi:succinoglycan biosynthesis protein ExoA
MIHLSVIIPVYNEAEHIAEVLDRLLAQNYDSDKLEIIVVDGMSTDDTLEIIQIYAAEHSNIRYFENPKKLASAARNIGIQKAQGEAVLIVDGHCIIDNDDMLLNVSKAFEETGADCLGRPQPLEMANATALQWAIATARRSPLGHHPDSFIYSDQAQFSPASSVAVAYRKSVFEKVGYFDETFDAAEDVEFNTRIDAAGLKCYFDPAIAIRYVPRKTIEELAFQMERYGRGRVRLWRKHPHTASWKSFAPGLFVFCTYFFLIFGGFPGMFMAFLTPFGIPIATVRNWMTIWGTIYMLIIVPYFAVALAESARLAFKQKRLDIAHHLPCVFLFVHGGYGFGILWEFFFGKRRRDSRQQTADGSRGNP